MRYKVKVVNGEYVQTSLIGEEATVEKKRVLDRKLPEYFHKPVNGTHEFEIDSVENFLKLLRN
jgi:hypothetical protein